SDPLPRQQPAPRGAGDARRAVGCVLLDPEPGERDEAHRRLLLELDVSIQSLGQANAPQADVLRLTGVYHNLLRTWSET
ncbi:hypothetical protein M1743_23725, partial [Salmonella enterica subsp. enterica serovar Saintpaul]|nr:hypothetical protein [Salmonella enterica subsp. enterica serovar Saintpaul]